MRKALLALFFLLLSGLAFADVSIGNTSLKLLSNTGECLGQCEAWIEWDASLALSDLSVPSKANSEFGFEFAKASPETPGLKSFGVEVWQFVERAVPNFCEVSKDVFEQCGTRLVGEWRNQGSFFGFTFVKGQRYRLRVFGEKVPRLGSDGIDWIPTIAGTRIGQWAWWSNSWYSKQAIQLPDQDINAGVTIQVKGIDFSAMAVQSDLDDVRVVDENRNVELDRLCDGTSASADGNCYFRMPNSLTAGGGLENTTYYLYYNNGSASSPPDSNASRATVCGFEDAENCFFAVNDSTDSTLSAAFGEKSARLVTGVDLNSVDSRNPLGSRGDLNYSYWMFDSNGDSSGGMSLIKSTGKYACSVYASGGDIKHNPGNKTIYTYAASTWYRVDTHYVDGDANCYYTVFDASGVALATKSSVVYEETGTVFKALNSVTSAHDQLIDNLYMAPPTLASGLGGAESISLRTDVNAWRVGGFDPAWQEFPAFVYVVDGNLTIDFNVFNFDNNRMLLDMNYSSSSSQGSGTAIVDDLNLTAAVCPDQNFASTVSCSWDWNISGVPDGNYYILLDVNSGGVAALWETDFSAMPKSFKVVEPRFTAEFHDENTGGPLVGLSVKINGGTALTTDSKGQVSQAISAAETYYVRAWDDANYGSRWFEFDVNVTDDVDVNVLMLRDVNGLDINFQFYQSGGSTLLANTRLWVYDEDSNLVSIRSTDSSGKVSFFLYPDTNNADGNYYFVTASGTRYDKVKVTFKRPLDEESLAVITPYDLDLTRLASKTFNTISTDLTIYLFPNTVKYYQFDLNGGTSYYPRKLEFNYKGNPASDTIQMYLPAVVDGLLSVFYTKNSADNTVEPDIFIRVFKDIVGAGKVEVQSVVTDAAGTATLSFVLDDEYTFDFYNSSGGFLFSDMLRPNFSTYYVYIDTGGFEWTEPSVEYISVQGLPNVGYVAYSDQGYDVNVTIDVNNGTIATSWLTISNDDGNVTFNQSCGSGCGYTIEAKDMNNTRDVKVTVYVVSASGLVFSKTWTFIPYDASGENWVATLKSAAFREEWGCSADPNEPCFFLLILSVFITIGICAAAGAGLTADRSALGIVAMISLGIFTYLTWIPVGFFLLSCLAVFGSLVLARSVF